jgi:microcystin-dependent protein
VIVMTAATTASTGYLLCAGQAVSRSTYADLFAVTSTRYGVGDNSTTFNIPNLTQRFPIGANTTVGNTTFATGNTGGAFDHTHSGPSHRHTISSDGSHSHTLGATTRDIQAGTGQSVIDGLDANTSANGAHTHGGFTGYEGTGNTGSANPPYVVVNFQIKF